MGGIESVTCSLFWPAIGCFFVADIFRLGGGCPGDLTDFFDDLTYFLAVALLVAHVVIMIIGMIKKGRKCLSEFQEPKKYLEFLLLLVGVSYIANIHGGGDWCSDYEAFYWVHGILYLIAIGFGLYLWVGQKKDFMIPEMIVIVLMGYQFGKCGPGQGGGNLALNDDVSLYNAISIFAFFILFLIILTNLIDQKTDVVDLTTGISYAIICIMTGSFPIRYPGLYGGFLLWLILLGLVIADLIKCNFKPDKLILPVVALGCIGFMYHDNSNGCDGGGDYTRSIYGIITLIGAYFSLVCAILLLALYIIVLVKGPSK